MKIALPCCDVSCCVGTQRFRNGNLDAKISQERIGFVYDKLSGIYDIWGRLTESRARSRAIELASIKDGDNILEVAVGTGLAFYEIVKRNPQGSNLGIDLSEGMLDKARHRMRKIVGANYRLAIGTAFDLPAQTESVDLLVNNYMFDLIPFADMDKVLLEFRRVLKADAKLILVNMTVGETRRSRLYEFIYRVSPRIMGGCRGVKLAEKLRQHGFTIETREVYQQLLFPSELILARKHA
jgi:demethylmenaquinone methyltransferase / 2-methoxy-6-polyprenyl-1,4-benzoquinol methylase